MAYTDPIDCAEYKKKWYTDNKDHVFWRRILTQYGITKDEAVSLIASQDFKCKLCDIPLEVKTLGTRRAHTDHCHKTNRVRGILCMPCNVGLGMLGDNAEGLTKALSYVKGELA